VAALARLVALYRGGPRGFNKFFSIFYGVLARHPQLPLLATMYNLQTHRKPEFSPRHRTFIPLHFILGNIKFF
jgi:hypothetical protein